MGKDAQAIDGRRVSQTNGGQDSSTSSVGHGEETVSRTIGGQDSSTSSAEARRVHAMRVFIECKTDPKTLGKFIFEITRPAVPHRAVGNCGRFFGVFDDCLAADAGFWNFQER